MPWATTVALGVGDAHLAEAEPPAALGDAGLGAQVDRVGGRGEVDRERDRRARPALSGTSSVAQAAAIAAVSIRAPIAPPWTTSPIVASSGLKGSSSTASSVPSEATLMPSCAACGEFGMNCLDDLPAGRLFVHGCERM